MPRLEVDLRLYFRNFGARHLFPMGVLARRPLRSLLSGFFAQETLTVTLAVNPPSGGLGTNFIITVYQSPPSSGHSEVTVEFGDGASIHQVNVALPLSFGHTYASAGTYTIQANVSDTVLVGGEWKDLAGSATAQVTVTSEVPAPLSVSFSSDVAEGVAPLEVWFTVGIEGGYEPYTYVVDFGDGTSTAVESRPSSGSFSFVHTYENGGTFNTVLTVWDTKKTQISRQITITVKKVPLTELQRRLRDLFPRLFRRIDNVTMS